MDNSQEVEKSAAGKEVHVAHKGMHGAGEEIHDNLSTVIYAQSWGPSCQLCKQTGGGVCWRHTVYPCVS